MKPNLEDMQVFLAIVEARTFTAAAEHLSRTKSAVSQALTRLENDIGTRLLYRSTRSLSLTEAGAQFYVHCRDIKNTYDDALANIKTNKSNPSGILSVTAPHALCGSVIVPAIAKFVEQHPQMNVRLFADDSPMDLIESQLDLAIRVGNLDMQSAKVSKLGMLSESLYASPTYIAARGGLPEDLTELKDWDHIANDWQGMPVKYQTLEGATLRVNPRIRCNALQDILRLVEIGAGLARLPDITVSHSISRGEIIQVMELDASAIHYMHLFSNRSPTKVQKFVKLIRDQLQ